MLASFPVGSAVVMNAVLVTVSFSCHLVARCERLCSSKVAVAVTRSFLCKERKCMPWPMVSLQKVTSEVMDPCFC